MAPRVLVIGLDGGEWRVLQPLVAQGRMPNLGRLLERGVRGCLASTVPPVTAPAWASFLTGVNPGKHGVFAFQRPLDQDLDRGWVNGAAIRAPKLWHYLEGQGLRCAFINVPMTYPPEPLPGYMVTCMLTPLGAERFTYPPDLSPPLRARGYVVELHVRLGDFFHWSILSDNPRSQGRTQVEREITSLERQLHLLQDLQEVARRRVEGVLWLWEREPVDLLAVVLETPDRVQHFFWGRLERALAEGPTDAVDEALLACYEEVDRGIGKLLALADAGTTVFVLSDHGFCGLHTEVHLDQWLVERGLLRYIGVKANLRRCIKAGLSPFLKRVLPHSWFLKGRKAFAVSRMVDWEHTRAYAGRSSENAVFLNLKGRGPKGTVELGQEYESLQEMVIRELQNLQDPRTGERVFRRVFRREEIYHGPYVDSAPDILFELTEGYRIKSEAATAGLFRDISGLGAGFHAQAGILVVAGAGVAGPGRVEGAHIQDLAPTLLHCLGLPVPTYMDGRVLEEVFTEEYRARHPVVRTETLPSGTPAREAGEVFSPEDEEEIRQRLAGLGYLS